MDNKEFWARLIKYLKLRNISLPKLAEACGMHRSSLYRQIERGVMPSYETVLKMEEYLGVKLTESTDEWDEYLFYLKKAEDWQLKSIRQILNMPEKILSSTKEESC